MAKRGYRIAHPRTSIHGLLHWVRESFPELTNRNSPIQKTLSRTYKCICSVCKKEVFFYQNEHGSKVFFNQLGHPWEKHGCYHVEPIYKVKALNFLDDEDAKNIHDKALKALRHAAEHSDFTNMTQLVNQQENIVIKKLLISWFLEFSPARYIKTKDGEKFRKDLKKDNPKYISKFKLAHETPFWELIKRKTDEEYYKTIKK